MISMEQVHKAGPSEATLRALKRVTTGEWGATIILSGITTIILAGGEKSKAA